MDLQDAKDKLSELGIYWEIKCPNVVKRERCPEEFCDIDD